MIQKQRDKTWIDESGMSIPYARTTPAERLKERHTAKLATSFEKYRAMGETVKGLAKKLCEDAYQADMRDKGVEPSDKKGSYTFFNFDRSIKVERSVHGNPTYDMATIEAAKIKFDEYLNNNLTTSEDFIKEMVKEAFESRGGKLDKNRINKLIRYRTRTKNQTFIQACDLLSTAVRYPSKSIYYRVWTRDEDGKYKNIDVQFSSL